MPRAKKTSATKQPPIPEKDVLTNFVANRLRLIQSKNNVTKPTMKASSSKNSSKKRPLTLKLFVNLPLDIVIEICTNVGPADLLSLSRVSKSFRTFFMSRSMQSLWRTVLEGVPYLPKCPEDLTEPQYASLVFDEFCMGCGSIRGTLEADYTLRLKLCKGCYKLNIVSGHALRRHCGPRTKEALSLLPSGSHAGGGYLLTGYSSTMNSERMLYFLPEAKLIIAEFESRKAAKENSVEIFDKFVADQQAIATRMIGEGALIRHWVDVEEHRRQNEVLINARRSRLEYEMRQLGWEWRFFPKEDDPDRDDWDDVIEIPEYLTLQGVLEALTELRPIYEACRSKYLKKVLSNRIGNLYGPYRARQPPAVRQYLPSSPDVMRQACVVDFIESKWRNAESCKEGDLVPLYQEIQRRSQPLLENAKKVLLGCMEGFDEQDKAQDVEPKPTLDDIGKAKVVFLCLCDDCDPEGEEEGRKKRGSKAKAKDPYQRTLLPYPDIITHWVDKNVDFTWDLAVQDITCTPEIVRAAGDVLVTLGLDRECSWTDAKAVVSGGLICDCDDVRYRGVIDSGRMVDHIRGERQLYHEINARVLPENKNAAKTELVDGHRADRLPSLLRRPRASSVAARKVKRGEVEWNYKELCATCYKLTRIVNLIEKGTENQHMRMMHGRAKAKGDMMGIDDLVARYGESPAEGDCKSKA